MSDKPASKLRIAVLISGGGTTLRNLIEKRNAGELDVDFRLVVSSNAQAGGLRFASEAGIPWVVLERSAYSSTEHYSRVVFNACRDAGADLVVMGGFLKHVLVPEDYAGRVMNIHPSLVPAFCGKGFYGQKVHAAALEYGVKVSGCTVHWVDDHYDHGPIILQRTVEVRSDDTPETLAARVFVEECNALPQAISWVAQGRLRLDGRRVTVVNDGSEGRP